MTGPRGQTCQRCSSDEWGQRADGHRYCAPCDRATSAKRRAKNGGALGLWDLARKRAQKSGVEFTIAVTDIEAAWPADGKCPVLGLELRAGSGKVIDSSPSLDRLNPEWGYTRDNIIVMSHLANRLKNNARASDLERIAAWMRSRGLD